MLSQTGSKALIMEFVFNYFFFSLKLFSPLEYLNVFKSVVWNYVFQVYIQFQPVLRICKLKIWLNNPLRNERMNFSLTYYDNNWLNYSNARLKFVFGTRYSYLWNALAPIHYRSTDAVKNEIPILFVYFILVIISYYNNYFFLQ